MTSRLFVAVPLGLLLLVKCAETPPTDPPDSGVTGTVNLGPQCPVEQADQPCDDEPAAGVRVTVSEQLPGEAYGAGPAVASGQTDANGNFRIDVPPGAYVVTAEAGMSCEFMDARVTAGGYTDVEVPCDTGIR